MCRIVNNVYLRIRMRILIFGVKIHVNIRHITSVYVKQAHDTDVYVSLQPAQHTKRTKRRHRSMEQRESGTWRRGLVTREYLLQLVPVRAPACACRATEPTLNPNYYALHGNVPHDRGKYTNGWKYTFSKLSVLQLS